MENLKRSMAAVLLAVLVLVPAIASAGQFFPDAEVEPVMSDAHRRYFGLADDVTSIRLSDVKTEYLLIDIFSLYCSPCQRDAPGINAMYDKIAELGLDDRIKFIGLGVGNTEREVTFWRERFDVEFPLVSDGNFALHELIGAVATPYYVLVGVEGRDKLRILLSHEGAVENKDDFLTEILARTGANVR